MGTHRIKTKTRLLPSLYHHWLLVLARDLWDKDTGSEDVFALSPRQWKASQGCTWPMLTQHCPGSGQVLNFLTTRCSQPRGTGEWCHAARHIPMMAAMMWSPVQPPSPSSWGPL